MKSYQLDITLQEDVVLSATASTLGGNHSLDYVPGATLLGAAAAALYGQVPAETAFHLFHSGAVRFGNAYIKQDTQASRPIPLAWHRLRNRAGKSQLLNHLLESDAGMKVKQEQLRSGFVTETGHLVSPQTSYRMKTAIDPKTASAATAQLFGYQSLQAGQQFQARLDIDDHEALDNSVVSDLLDALGGSLLLGRSRSAQYGEAVCEVSALQDCSTDSGDTSETSLVFWLQSDLALQDAYGQPVLMPSAEHFGIDGQVDSKRSFLRFRSYSPYNSYRHSYDNVRQVITQGSIITFQLNAPVSDEVKNSWLSGVGLYRECGLGQVLINHPLLLNAVPTPPVIHPVPDVLGEPPNHPMAKWLLSQTQSGGQQQRLREQAEQCGRELDALYKAARRYAGEPSGVAVGPGRSQWGKVSEIAKQYASGGQSDGLFFALFDENNNQAVCSQSDAAWKTATGPAATDNYTDWLKGHLEKEKDNPGLLAANLAQIARNVVAKQEVTQ